jgi:hypothetical protein
MGTIVVILLVWSALSVVCGLFLGRVLAAGSGGRP